MSMDYAIKMKLATECNEDNIAKILERGLKKGFTYYDHIMGIRYRNSPILDARRAAQKIQKAFMDKTEDGPCVYTVLDENTGENVTLWFYESDESCLIFRMGVFGIPKKKEHFIDFDHYIRLCLDICQDFPILEFQTTMI